MGSDKTKPFSSRLNLKNAKDGSYILILLSHNLKRPIEIGGEDHYLTKTEKRTRSKLQQKKTMVMQAEIIPRVLEDS